ncbi:MAG: DUF2058 family protein [Myxococcales bacterium]|nr:DUF2058 family protein [Myxococcales bacterium]
MQSLRDQLLKAGLVTEDQVSKVEAADASKVRKKRRKKPSKPASERAPGSNGERRMPMPRVMELNEPSRLQIFQAIERHRVRGETRGEMEFYFKLRDGRVRKMFVSKEISGGLQSGRLAIVENGEPEKHIIVGCDAVSPIAEIDPGMVRFFNQF